jgi:tetratricopeptide (TPR) repeat protein
MSTFTKEHLDLEAIDAAKVDDAMRAIRAGEISCAKELLLSVIENTPREYTYQTVTGDGALSIKFWDKDEFIHYVNWMAPEREIIWMGSAYPRAFFHLGFIAVQQGTYDEAIDYLDQGALLEPSNPKFTLEKAHALIHLGEFNVALKLFSQISSEGPFVSRQSVSAALRGKGTALIEMGLLHDAESEFHESLKFDPENEIAHSELKYIAHLKAGGKALATIKLVKKNKEDV